MDKDKRRFGRFGTSLKAYCKISEAGEEKHDCIIINMSRKGCGLQIKAEKKINKDADIRLEIYVPEKKTPALVKGTIKWVEKRGDVWTAGVECLQIIDELEFSKRS